MQWSFFVMIGLSLSLCVIDIVKNNIPLSDVEKIVTSTMCPTQQDWEEVIAAYKQLYWDDFPDQAEIIARQLLANDKIEQPALTRGEIPDVGRTISIWVPSMKDIAWRTAKRNLR